MRVRRAFESQILETSSYHNQNFIVCLPEAAIRILEYLKLEEDFDFLVDLTAVDYPLRRERFELIYILFSHARNERLRLKTSIADGAKPPSAVPVFPGANWLEREVFDLFGIEFFGHPHLTRILMPDEWTGHPLRKDYPILQMDNQWVQENLGIPSGQ
ncbi:MAG: NADH-quinone oxidoreductase subunit C [Bryobacteraceae bacterium]